MSRPLTLALAAQRLTQLIVQDEMTRPLRISVEKWAQDSAEFSFKERVHFALNCGACTSVYAGAAVLVLDRFTVGRALNTVLATSAAALGIAAAVEKLGA